MNEYMFYDILLICVTVVLPIQCINFYFYYFFFLHVRCVHVNVIKKYQRALEGRERVLGVDHPHTLTSVNNLGTLLQTQGKLEEAEVLYRRALEGRERVSGVDHPDTLLSMRNLAALLEKIGDLSSAESFACRSLEGVWRETAHWHSPSTKQDEGGKCH